VDPDQPLPAPPGGRPDRPHRLSRPGLTPPPARRGRRARALLAVLGAGAALAIAGAAWSAPADEKADVDGRLERARDRLAQARDRESVLTGEVQGYTDRIRALEARLAPLRERSARLDAELAALRDRLGRLTRRLAIEQERLSAALAELALREGVLSDRLRDLYSRGEPDPVLVLLESGSLSEAVAAAELLETIADRDRDAAQAVKTYAAEVRRTRDAIAEVRAEVADAEAQAEVVAGRARAAKAALEREQAGLEKVRAGRQALLGRVRGDREEIEAEARGLEKQSAALANRIRRAQGLAPAPSGSVAVGPASAAGLVWPVGGQITSGFGPRWGRMHEGLDIAGSSGTPIAAAATGTVISAGWSGGYGQLVVLDHGNGLSTAYAHLSSISVSAGQTVPQGSAVGGMGTTGSSTGVHLHFEVRVNGAAVDPLGYL
jgi:murein DD-endopeptidase MepM/ murein hydrolase activator NlpD